jgi:hypothetical protein
MSLEGTSLLVRCTACSGTGKITLRQKAEHRDGDASWLNPEKGVYWRATYYPDGSVEQERREVAA